MATWSRMSHVPRRFCALCRPWKTAPWWPPRGLGWGPNWTRLPCSAIAWDSAAHGYGVGLRTPAILARAIVVRSTQFGGGSWLMRLPDSLQHRTPQPSRDNPPGGAATMADPPQQPGTLPDAHDSALLSRPNKMPQPWPHSRGAPLPPAAPGPWQCARDQGVLGQTHLYPIKSRRRGVPRGAAPGVVSGWAASARDHSSTLRSAYRRCRWPVDHAQPLAPPVVLRAQRSAHTQEARRH